MDITPFLDLKPAPRAIFDNLAERKSRPRYMLPTADGDWTVVTWGAMMRTTQQAIESALEHATAIANGYLSSHEGLGSAVWGVQTKPPSCT